MEEKTLQKLRTTLLYIFIILLSLLIAYVLVYPIGFLPSGYQMISQGEQSITLQHNNIIGLEEKMIVFNPKDHEWQLGYVVDSLENQKFFLVMFLTTVFVSFVLFLYRMNKGETLKQSFLKSGMISTIFTLLSYIQAIHGIEKYVL
ncbi:hypothetical protein NC661_02110 [Aquibacillus koreensis]|uniref:Uncharacterized protein n=1 Tax=Aquibacillus koreensis TaxID=279446 RepID=A0A9X3WG23_9BACI|nr:hypothetical protein [Aquibacillus koreensis]MCT2537937.1 hypothetical protein [Aquibacillus koreensis]MDC3419172.1 hypothetical protein [Aquibacillus koreensis]